ncbi:hypothetical protein [Jatrophihabitans sp. GAS493]|uniref:hypothetical protein n=1 Tax=Jatrophihabitans sp. GAS493 TaxID=1907575 RepID=UPI000BB98B02|nr:hypothetical protein [Jatrophihabitans sp. GAS493]
MPGGEHNAERARFSRRRKVLVALLALVAVWLAACTMLLVFPSVDSPTKADAVVVLGPPGAARLKEAMTLLDDGVATNLVISVNSVKQRAANALCRNPPAGITVHCFHPDPPTTRGEGASCRN